MLINPRDSLRQGGKVGGRKVDLEAEGSDGGILYKPKRRWRTPFFVSVLLNKFLIQSKLRLYSAGYSIFVQLIKSVLLLHCSVVNLSRETGNSLNKLCCDK